MGNKSSSDFKADMANIQEFIQGETSGHEVVVFSKSYCPYCTSTKQLFSKMKGIDVAVHELDRMPNGQSVQNELSRMTGQRTVPSVWVGGKFLGGNDDTQAAASSGKLKEMLGK